MEIKRHNRPEGVRNRLYQGIVATALLGFLSLPAHASPIPDIANPPNPVPEGLLPLGTTDTITAQGLTHCYDLRTVHTEETDATIVGLKYGPEDDPILELYEGACVDDKSPRSEGNTSIPSDKEVVKPDGSIRFEFDLPQGAYKLLIHTQDTGNPIELAADSDGRILVTGRSHNIPLNEATTPEIGSISNNGMETSTSEVTFTINGKEETSSITVEPGTSKPITSTIKIDQPGIYPATLEVCPEAIGGILQPECETVSMEFFGGHMTYIPFVSKEAQYKDPCDDPENTCISRVIVVNGRFANHLRDAIARSSGILAQAFKNSMGEENVAYISSDEKHCQENPNVDTCVKYDTDLLAAIGNFLADTEPGLVMISLIDHGKQDGSFQLAYLGKEYELTPEELMSYLADRFPDHTFVLISGICSGGQLAIESSKYKGQFAVATSAGANESAYATEGPDGKYGDQYSIGFAALAHGRSVGDIHQSFIPKYQNQHPQANADGDNILNEPEDLAILSKMHIRQGKELHNKKSTNQYIFLVITADSSQQPIPYPQYH